MPPTRHPAIRRRPPSEGGFTLIEVLVVLAIIALAYKIVMVNAGI